VIAPSRKLGVHHFAFLRAGFVGVDAAYAFDRFLAWGETSSDPRHVQHRRAEILKLILDAGRRLDLTLPAEQKITRLLDLLREHAGVRPAALLPTLDAWMRDEGMDPDLWSEAEALAEYRAAHGLDNQDAIDAAEGLADQARARVSALNHLQTLLALAPAPADAVDIWFARPIAVRLRNAGVRTLEDLANFINVYGHRWHGQLKGFGARRAARVVAWLRAQQDSLQLEIRASVDEPRQARALRLGVDAGRLSLGARFGLVPLEHLALPAPVSGIDGVLRSHMPNALEASDDLQAITRWLSRYGERPATARSYRKEIERFVLWCTTVQRKAVSSASSLDCQAYRAFLAAVPAHWVHPVPVERSDPAWRPFRGQPGPASQKQALVIVQTMFEGLRDAGYLVANPMRSVMKGFRLPKTRLDVKRSFTEAEWAHVLLCLAATPLGAGQLRLRCILELLVSSGIRLDELAKATRADLRLESLPGLQDTWVLSVTGKRNKQRDVPLANDVIELLDAHARSFAAEDEAVEDRASLPLVRGLAASVEQWARDERHGTVSKAAVTGQGGAALSAAGIYAAVKRFMLRAARTAPAAGLDAARFEQASTHWMRHTFVRQALVDGVPIEVVSELAGHASIATTSIYSSQELARKIEAIRGMKRRSASTPG
jgi:site-specific recombinase XerD